MNNDENELLVVPRTVTQAEVDEVQHLVDGTVAGVRERFADLSSEDHIQLTISMLVQRIVKGMLRSSGRDQISGAELESVFAGVGTGLVGAFTGIGLEAGVYERLLFALVHSFGVARTGLADHDVNVGLGMVQ